MSNRSTFPSRANEPDPVAVVSTGFGRSAAPLRMAVSGIAGWFAVSDTRKNAALPMAGSDDVLFGEKVLLIHIGSLSPLFVCRANGPTPPPHTTPMLVPTKAIFVISTGAFWTLMLRLTGAEVLTAPRLSVATAVS